MCRHFAIALLDSLRPITNVVANLVGSEIAASQPSTGLQANDIDSGFGDWQRGDTSGRA